MLSRIAAGDMLKNIMLANEAMQLENDASAKTFYSMEELIVDLESEIVLEFMIE